MNTEGHYFTKCTICINISREYPGVRCVLTRVSNKTLTGSLIPSRVRLVRFDSYSLSIIRTMKTKFVCVQPRTNKAKNRFYNLMHELHSCRVEQETEDKLFLTSITDKYSFWMDKTNDMNWMICK